MREVRATRYVTAFREGGSLPGLVEADDDGLYVVKFRGAGQGPRVLVAEWIAGEIGRALGLDVPDLVAVDLVKAIADSEPDQEIHDLLVASVGRNIGLDFLPGAADVQPGRGRRRTPTGRRRRLARRARDEPGPLAAEPEPARLARPAVADRPRRGAVHPPHLARPGRARPPAARERLADHVLLPFASSDRGRRRAARAARDPRAAGRARGGAPGRLARRGSGHRRRRTTSAGRTSATSCDGSRRRGRSSRRPSGAPGGGGLMAGHPFQYAIVRVVPRVERGESLNAGVILLCRPKRFLAARVGLDVERLRALAPDVDPATIEAAPRRRSSGSPRATRRPARSPRLGQAERFHWLVAPSSTVIQPSEVHTGLCDDPAEELDHLFERLVR